MSQPLPSSERQEHSLSSSCLPGELSLFHAITEHIPDAAVFVVDQKYRYLLAGGGGLANTGMSPADFEGKYVANKVPPEMLEQLLLDYSTVFAGGTFIREHSVGSRSYRTRGRLIKGVNGALDVVLAISYDITNEAKVSGLSLF